MNNKTLLKTIIILALPAIAEMALNTLLGFTDTLMISRLIGQEALAGVGFANQIIYTLIFVFTSFNTGATAMIARSYGEQNFEKLNKVAGQVVALNFVLGLTISIFSLIFAEKLFSIYDMTPEVLELTLQYFNIVVYGMIFMFLSFSFTAILRGSGDTKTPMIITGIVNVVNIVGNYVLITGYGPFPELGIRGTAIATTISRGVATIIYIKILFSGDNGVHLKLKNLKITKEIIKPLWNISLPGAVEQGLMQIAFVFTGVIISFLDTTSEAAFRILLNIESISFMPAIGLSIAAATLVGKALGEKDAHKAKKIGHMSAGIGAVWGVFMGILFLSFPNFFVGIFTDNKTLINVSLFAMTFMGLNSPLLNFTVVLSGALRGSGDTKSVMIITTLRLWLVFVPLNYVLVKFFNYGIESVWIAEMTSFLIFSIIMFLRFERGNWANIKIYDK